MYWEVNKMSNDTGLYPHRGYSVEIKYMLVKNFTRVINFKKRRNDQVRRQTAACTV